MADSVRYLILALCAFSLGTLAALYERVARFMLPKLTVRLLLLACALSLLSIMVDVGERLGQHFRARIVIALVSVIFYVIALVGLYRWFSHDEGRRKRHAIVNEYAAHELHELADLARALEEDPEHVGRYVGPGWFKRIGMLLRVPWLFR